MNTPTSQRGLRPMAYVSVPKDLTKVKNKLAFNLTRRQLICIGIGAAIGIPFYFLTRNVIGMSNAATVMVLLMLPAFLFTLQIQNQRTCRFSVICMNA